MSKSDEHRESAIEAMARYLYPEAFDENLDGHRWHMSLFGDTRTPEERMAEARFTARVKVEMALDRAEPHLRAHFHERIARDLRAKAENLRDNAPSLLTGNANAARRSDMHREATLREQIANELTGGSS